MSPLARTVGLRRRPLNSSLISTLNQRKKQMSKTSQFWLDETNRIINDYCDGALIYEEAHNKLTAHYGGGQEAAVDAADALQIAYGEP